MPAPIFITDFSTNYLSWDGLESVQYELARLSLPAVDSDPQLRKGQAQPTPFDPARAANANQPFTINNVKRRSIHSAEKSPSGGVYIAYELNWWINQAELPDAFVSKAGDVIIDADQNRWTILRTLFNAPTGNWQLGVVNLVLANDLRETLNIERATVTYDAAGSANKLFPTVSASISKTSQAANVLGGEVLYKNLPCRGQLQDQEIADERGIRGFKGVWSFTVAHEVAVTNEDRIVFRGQYFEIRKYNNATRIDELPTIDAELMP